MGNPATFIILAVIALASAAGVLLSRNAIHSAMYLVLNFVTIAVFYILLEAPFISMVQITVYAGAIVVLFLFVIMLLGAERLGGAGLGRGWQFYGASMLAIVLLTGLLSMLMPNADPAAQITIYVGAVAVMFLFVAMPLGAERLGGTSFNRGALFYGAALLIAIALLTGLLGMITPDVNPVTVPELDASPEAIGMLLFESYVFPFEITSILLLVAMMSLVVWQTQKKRKN